MKKTKTWALALIATAALTACGGGDDDDSTTPPPAASSITITGSADNGTAMANAAIGIKCSNGTFATATAGADGSFSVPISNANLPCAVRAEATDGTGTVLRLTPGKLTRSELFIAGSWMSPNAAARAGLV